MAPTLSTLPLELKRLIVQACREQDEWWNIRFIGTQESKSKEAKEKFLGRSVQALFSLNREFNGLAAQHIFRALTLGQIAGKTWRLKLALTYGCHVRHLDLTAEASTRAQKVKLISRSLETILCSMTHLESIKCDIDAVSFWKVSADPAVTEEDLDAFKRIMGQIVALSLPGDSIAKFSPLLKLASLLRSVTLSGSVDITTLNNTLSAHSTLRSLSLEQPTGMTEGAQLALPLSSLAILYPNNHASVKAALHIISSSRDSLESLIIDFKQPAVLKEMEFGDDWSSNFPLLKTLTIRGSTGDVFRILELFKDSPLRDLTVHPRDLDRTSEQSSLLLSFKGSLQTVTCSNRLLCQKWKSTWTSMISPLREQAIPQLRFLDDSKSFDQALVEWTGTPSDPEYVSKLCVDSVEAEGRYATRQAQYYKRMGDHVALRQLHKLLEPIFQHRDLDSDIPCALSSLYAFQF